MGLAVRAFGLGAWSLLLPQALMGVATVGILFATVRRWAGAPAGLLAALTLAVTPVAVLMSRFDDPDALLTLLLVAGAWALTRGIDSGRLRWLVLSAALVGLGFETKFLQAWLVLPAFGLVVLVGGAGGIGRRLGHLFVAGITVLLASGWWVAAVEAIPLPDRPFIGGSVTGGPLELLLGYDGLGRIVGAGPGGVFAGAGAMFGGAPGVLRLLGEPWAGGIGWLLPVAVVLAIIGCTLRILDRPQRGRRDPHILGYLLWGGWLATQVVVFSLMSGIVHSYYAVTLAPAVAALVGMGILDLWQRRRRSSLGGLLLAVCVMGTAWWADHVLTVATGFLPWLGPVLLALGIASGILLVLPRRVMRRIGQGQDAGIARDHPAHAGIAGAGLALALTAILLGPAAWSFATTGVAQAGGDPVAGPAESVGGGLGGFVRAGLRSGFGAGTGLFPGADVRRSVMVSWLLEHRSHEDWIAATTGATDAAAIQLAADAPVLDMGGFIGSDPTPTMEQLQGLVRQGRLRFVLQPQGPVPGGLFLSGIGRARDEWVRDSCTLVQDERLSGRISVYDCSAA